MASSTVNMPLPGWDGGGQKEGGSTTAALRTRPAGVAGRPARSPRPVPARAAPRARASEHSGHDLSMLQSSGRGKAAVNLAGAPAFAGLHPSSPFSDEHTLISPGRRMSSLSSPRRSTMRGSRGWEGRPPPLAAVDDHGGRGRSCWPLAEARGVRARRRATALVALSALSAGYRVCRSQRQQRTGKLG